MSTQKRTPKNPDVADAVDTTGLPSQHNTSQTFFSSGDALRNFADEELCTLIAEIFEEANISQYELVEVDKYKAIIICHGKASEDILDLKFFLADVLKNRITKKAASFKIDERRESQIYAWITRSIHAKIKEAARKNGLTQQQWFSRLIEGSLGEDSCTALPSKKSEPRDCSFAGLSSDIAATDKKAVKLKLELDLAAALDGAVQEAGVAKNDWLRASIIKSLTDGLEVLNVLDVT